MPTRRCDLFAKADMDVPANVARLWRLSSIMALAVCASLGVLTALASSEPETLHKERIGGWTAGMSDWLVQSQSKTATIRSSVIDRDLFPVEFTQALLLEFAKQIKPGMTLSEAADALGYPDWSRDIDIFEFQGSGALPLSMCDNCRMFACTFPWLPEADRWDWKLSLVVSGIGGWGDAYETRDQTVIDGDLLFRAGSASHVQGVIESFRMDSRNASDCFYRDGVRSAMKLPPFPVLKQD